MQNELFMIHTYDMYLIGYQKTMAEVLKMSYVTLIAKLILEN